MGDSNLGNAADPIGNYSEANIVVLEALEAIRKRPGMYVGSTGSQGVHLLLTELLDNSVGQTAGGSGKSVAVELRKNGSATVRDDGPGFPVEIDKGMPALEQAMTRFAHGSSSRFGLGLMVLNALSASVEVEVRRRGFLWRQQFARGRLASPLERLGPTRETGTAITFRPDPEIFTEASFEAPRITERLAELAVLNPEVRFDFRDERSGRDQSWERRGGLVDLVCDLNRRRKTLHEPIAFTGRAGKTEVRFAFQYHDGSESDLQVFANQARMADGLRMGGMSAHAVGFLKALRRALGSDHFPWSPTDQVFDASPPSIVLPGLTAAVALRLEDPIFEGATREKLGNPSAKYVAFSVAYLRILAHFEENPEVARRIRDKVRQSTAIGS